MDQYSNYIRKLKQTAPKADFTALLQKVEERSARPARRVPVKPMIGLALAVIFLGLLTPLLSSRNVSAAADNRLTAYVFQNERAGDHVVADFILGD